VRRAVSFKVLNTAQLRGHLIFVLARKTGITDVYGDCGMSIRIKPNYIYIALNLPYLRKIAQRISENFRD